MNFRNRHTMFFTEAHSFFSVTFSFFDLQPRSCTKSEFSVHRYCASPCTRTQPNSFMAIRTLF